MRGLKFLSLTAILASALALSVPAGAAVWNESAAGAGESLATAEDTTGPGGGSLTAIFGQLDAVTLVDALPRTQVDLYRIFISDTSSFSARTVSSNPDDTALFLFDKTGHGIYTNDDTADSLLSFLPSTGGPLVPDFYFLAVALGGYIASDSFDVNLFLTGSFSDVLGADPAAGPLSSFNPSFASFNEGSTPYSIELTGVQVTPIPEPETVLLMLAGLAGVMARAAARGRRRLR